MALSFKNAALNKDFEILADADQEIQTPDGYNGKLTDVPNAEILHGMVKRKSNLVKIIVSASASTTSNNNNEDTGNSDESDGGGSEDTAP